MVGRVGGTTRARAPGRRGRARGGAELERGRGGRERVGTGKFEWLAWRPDCTGSGGGGSGSSVLRAAANFHTFTEPLRLQVHT